MAQMLQKGKRTLLSAAITVAQLWSGKAMIACVEQLLPQPTSYPAWNMASTNHLCEFTQDKIGIDSRLRLKITCIIFIIDRAFAFLKKQRGLNSVGNFLNKNNERRNITLVERVTGIVGFKFLDDRT